MKVLGFEFDTPLDKSAPAQEAVLRSVIVALGMRGKSPTHEDVRQWGTTMLDLLEKANPGFSENTTSLEDTDPATVIIFHAAYNAASI